MGEIQDVVTELAQLQTLMQKESNAIPANGKKRREAAAAAPIARACADDGSRDLCDDHVCHFDGECRSGCCSQVLT